MSKIKEDKPKKYGSFDVVCRVLQHTYCTILCDECEVLGQEAGVTHQAGSDLFKKGWRATKNKVYCPKCSKKKLKNINA